MPGHFRAFLRVTGNKIWKQIISECQKVFGQIQSRFSPDTGLLPDFIVSVSKTDFRPKPAPARFLEGVYDGDYYYNACRVPWRIGTDALLNDDMMSFRQTRKIAQWILKATHGLPSKIKPGYKLNGRPLSSHDFFSKVFVATLGIAAMTTPSQQKFLNRIFNIITRTNQDYYEDTVSLLCMLVMTGNFWDPTHIDARKFSNSQAVAR
jgi:hypothetical protein